MSTTAMEVGGFSEIEAQLTAQIEAGHPPTWMPTSLGGEHQPASDEITGKVAKYTQARTSYDDSLVDIMVIESLKSPGSFVSVWLLHETLKGAIRDNRPRPGEMVKLRYEGKTTPKGGGNEYHLWKVAVLRDEALSPSYLPWEVPQTRTPTTSVETGDNGTTAFAGGGTGEVAEAPPTPTDDDIPF